MPDTEGPTLSLGLDASAAERGAKSFADAIDRIISAGRRAAEAVDNLGGEARDLGPSMDRAGGAASRLGREVDSAGTAVRRVERDFASAGQSASLLGRSFSFAQSMAAGFAAGIGVGAFNALANAIASIPQQVIQIGDAYARLDSRLSQAVRGLTDVGTAHEDLYQVSQRLGVAFESTAGFFTRIASQSRELGLSYTDLVNITQTLEGAFKLSGASADETSRAMMQLGQAFGSGKLQGDEFKSIAETTPAVLDRLAETLGVTRGQLLEMAQAGQLSTAVLADAIKKMSSGVESDLQSMDATVGEATTQMRNAWNELLADLNSTGGASGAAVSAIQSLTAFLESDSAKGAVVEFAGAFKSLISVLQSVIEISGGVAGALNKILGMAQDAGKAVSGAVQGSLGAINKAISTVIPPSTATPLVAGAGMAQKLIEKSGMAAPVQRIRESIGAAKPQRDVAGLGKIYVGDIAADALDVLETTAKQEAIDKFSENMKAWQKSSQDDIRRVVGTGKPAARFTGMVEAPEAFAPKARGGGGRRAAGGGAARAEAEPRLEFDSRPFDDEIRNLERVGEGAMTDTQRRAQDMLAAITEAHAMAFADQARIIEMKRDKDLDALNTTALNAEEKARARTMIEEAASYQILQIRQRELDQSLGYMEQLEQAYNRQFRLDSSGNRAREIQRSQQLRQLEEQRNLSPEQRGAARSMILDMTQPTTELERAGEAMVEFGERMTGVEGMTQGVIQGIAQIGSTASAAFADAIMSGESFSDTLSKLGESLARMMIQMTMQLAMQQLIGAAVGGIGGMIAPQPGAGAGAGAGSGGYAAAGLGGGLFAGGGTGFFASGGVVDTGLAKGIYDKPTYFPLQTSGKHAFAKGAGLLGEAGPEAVLPLTRTPSGDLGVQSQGAGANVEVNVIVNNSSRAQVSTESRGNTQGGKDILLSIADQVEGIIATRMSRSGTMVNRAVGGVGQVTAR